MLSKKESLLVRPFVLRKYENHRRKVVAAEPVIDIHCPINYPHVIRKTKKVQRERERLNEIERENQRLLTKLGQIMNKNRLENYWREPRPYFVNRITIPILPNPRSKSAVIGASASTMPFPYSLSPSPRSGEESGLARPADGKPIGAASSRCTVCNKTYVEKRLTIPEERIPWAPVRKPWSSEHRKPKPPRHECCKFCC